MTERYGSGSGEEGHRPSGHGAVTERLAREIVTIPCFTELEEDEISQVIAAVNRW